MTWANEAVLMPWEESSVAAASAIHCICSSPQYPAAVLWSGVQGIRTLAVTWEAKWDVG